MKRMGRYDKEIEKYEAHIQQYGLLTKEEEINLFKRYQDNDDMEAYHALVNHNLVNVVMTAKSYWKSNKYILIEDLIATGNEALVKSIPKYKIDSGYRFYAYLKRSMFNAFINYNIIDRSVRIGYHHMKDDMINTKPVYIEDEEGFEFDIDYTPPSITKELNTEDDLTTLEHCLSLINDKDVESLTKIYGLFDTDKHKQVDMAREEGLSKGIVHNRRARIIEKIRKRANIEK